MRTTPPLSNKPPVRIAYFFPCGSADSEYDLALYCRVNAIFEPLNLSDPMFEGWGNSGQVEPPSTRKPFNLVPSEFLRWAQANPPQNPVATASAFADWVYSLYNSTHSRDDAAMVRGLAMERVIFEQRARYREVMSFASSSDNAMLKKRGLPWRLRHCGLHLDTEKDTVDCFELENLSVHGEPLRVSPDLVYVNTRSGDVIVVEIKFSRNAITTNLWPNVWAQLWIYAHIPAAIAAPRVTVIGEIWGEWFAPRKRLRAVGLRASVRRDPREHSYDRFFRALFDIYRGECR
jgi:hypothetical protein